MSIQMKVRAAFDHLQSACGEPDCPPWVAGVRDIVSYASKSSGADRARQLGQALAAFDQGSGGIAGRIAKFRGGGLEMKLRAARRNILEAIKATKGSKPC